jgi:hypothetical protein
MTGAEYPGEPPLPPSESVEQPREVSTERASKLMFGRAPNIDRAKVPGLIPARGQCLVLDLLNFKAPMLLYGNDGTKAVPEGGILLDSAPPDSNKEERGYTVCPAAEAAQAAIDRTVAHGLAQQYGECWEARHYAIVDRAEYEASLISRAVKAAKKRGKGVKDDALPDG